MNAKQQYELLFDSHFGKCPNEETAKVCDYLSDRHFLLSDPTTGKPFLGQAVDVMEQLVNEENGNLEEILARTRGGLSPYIPIEGVTDLDAVDWEWVGIEYLCTEVFDAFEKHRK